MVHYRHYKAAIGPYCSQSSPVPVFVLSFTLYRVAVTSALRLNLRCLRVLSSSSVSWSSSRGVLPLVCVIIWKSIARQYFEAVVDRWRQEDQERCATSRGDKLVPMTAQFNFTLLWLWSPNVVSRVTLSPNVKRVQHLIKKNVWLPLLSTMHLVAAYWPCLNTSFQRRYKQFPPASPWKRICFLFPEA